MKTFWKDIVTSLLFLAGAVTVFAKLQDYSWVFLGSWKSALAVLAVLGAGLLITDFSELARSEDLGSFIESTMWVVTTTVIIGNLFADTTKTGFLVSAGFLAATWLIQTIRRINWEVHHPDPDMHDSHYAAAH